MAADRDVSSKQLKLAAAAIGTGVLVTMGALTLAGTGSEINSTQPSLGETITRTTAPSSPETSVATPGLIAPTSEGEWQTVGPG